MIVLRRDRIGLNGLNPNRIPSSNFHKHHVELLRRREKRVRQWKKKKKRAEFIRYVLDLCKYVAVLPSKMASFTIPYLVLWAQVILAIVRWYLDLGDHTWIYFLSPLVFIIFYLCIVVPLGIIWLLNYDEIRCDMMAITIVATALIWFECTPLVMLVLNLGVLPRFPMRLYHVDLIPWPAVFAPWAITLFILSVLLLAFGFACFVSPDIEDEGLSNLLAGFCVSFVLFYGGLIIVILGFALEFFSHFLMPLAFIPIMLAAIVTQLLLIVAGLGECGYKFTERNVMLFPTVILVSVIPCCFAQLIGPFCLLGPMVFVTQLFLMNVLDGSSFEDHCCIDLGRMVLCCVNRNGQ